MLRNAGVSVDSRVRSCVIDFPVPTFVTVKDTSEVELFEMLMVARPRDNLVFQ